MRTYWNTPTHPNGLTPRQKLQRIARTAAAVLLTAATVAVFLAVSIILN